MIGKAETRIVNQEDDGNSEGVLALYNLDWCK